MRTKIKIGVMGALLGLWAAAESNAATLVQPLGISLVVFDQQTATTTTAVRIGTKDVIRLLAGTNAVAGAQLLLVTPAGNTPGGTGNLNAFLRITKGGTVIQEVPSPASFNLFQDFASTTTRGNRIATFAINRFSFDFNRFHAELQGFSVWSSPLTGVLSGTGTFTSAVNGSSTLDGVTVAGSPTSGTIAAGAPVVVN